MAFWSSWTWGQKNHMGDFLTKIIGKKNGISCSDELLGLGLLLHLSHPNLQLPKNIGHEEMEI
jgi:hypothetical protein